MPTHAVFVDEKHNEVARWQNCLEPITGDHFMANNYDIYEVISKEYHRLDDSTIGVTITVKKV